MVAAQTAFSAIELAVRLRSEAEGIPGKLRGLSDAMQRAINDKWIADDEKRCRPHGQQQIFSPETGLTHVELSATEQFVDVLGKVFPKYRNALAHGSSMMHHLGADMVLDANMIINRIFPQTQSIPGAGNVGSGTLDVKSTNALHNGIISHNLYYVKCEVDTCSRTCRDSRPLKQKCPISVSKSAPLVG